MHLTKTNYAQIVIVALTIIGVICTVCWVGIEAQYDLAFREDLAHILTQAGLALIAILLVVGCLALLAVVVNAFVSVYYLLR